MIDLRLVQTIRFLDLFFFLLALFRFIEILFRVSNFLNLSKTQILKSKRVNHPSDSKHFHIFCNTIIYSDGGKRLESVRHS